MKKYFLTILTLLFFVGCSNPPQNESNRMTLGKVQGVVKKGANQTDIMLVLGAPNIISKDRQGRETWTYDRISQDRDSQSSGFYFLFFGSSKASSSKSSKSLTAIITFDDNKSVVDFAYQSLEY
jgi:Predicted periplasmic lipoprotein